MLKFVVFLSLLSGLLASGARAQELSDKDAEKLKTMAIELSYIAFTDIRAMRQVCVGNQVMDDSFKTVIVGSLAGVVGENRALKGQIAGLPAGKGRFLRKGTAIGVFIALSNIGYYLYTGNNLLTVTEIHRWYERWIGAGPYGNQALANYYMTERGFQEFLNITDEAEVKRAFELNPRLMIAVALARKLTIMTNCGALKGIDPSFGGDVPDLNRLKQKSLDQKPKGEAL